MAVFKFVDREMELEGLRKLWDSGKAEMLILYGRRRVGKTELLRRFCNGKRSLYFLAAQMRDVDNLRGITQAMRLAFDDPLLSTVSFEGWDGVLEYLARKGKDDRLAVVLDEFQYLCEDNPALPSIIQRFWDTQGRETKLFLILCGSYISFMEREVLGERSPLFGRRTAQLRLMPMNYRDATLFFSSFTPRQRMIIYGILGGMPGYLVRFSREKGIRENIIDEMLNVQGYLHDEVNFLLRSELREPRVYASLLSAIASGCTRQSEIANRVGMNLTSVNKYLGVLMELGLVERRRPMHPSTRKRGIYVIADNYVRFWFRFVSPYLSLIEAGEEELVYDRFIKPQLDNFMGAAFEDICRQYLRFYWRERFDTPIKSVGGYWDGFCEIDIVAECVDGSHVIGECKWSRRPIGAEVGEELISKSGLLPSSLQIGMRYVIFSAGGFRDDLIEFAEEKGITLISLGEMF